MLMTGDILCRRGRFGKPNDHRLLASRLDRLPGDRPSGPHQPTCVVTQVSTVLATGVVA